METRISLGMAKTMQTTLMVSLTCIFCLSFAEVHAFTGNQFKLGVTYYSFYADGSALEFGAEPGGSKVKLLNALDTERKPVMDPAYGDSTTYAKHVDRWFRAWRSGNPVQVFHDAYPQKKDSTNCQYNQMMLDLGLDSATAWVCDYTFDTIPAGYSTCDTCMKNIAIDDSLTATLTPGTYNGTTRNFYIMGALFGAFLPISDRTIDGASAMFTMECHYTFTYHGGEVVIMDSDDDSWFFINNLNALDLGGLRNGPPDTLELSTLGLTVGQVYNADFFFANRLQGSRFYLKTDIDFTAPIVLGTEKGHAVRPTQGKSVCFGKSGTLFVPEATVGIDYSIVDASGRMCSQANYSLQNNHRVPVASLPVGLYIVKSVCKNSENKKIAIITSRIFIAR